MLLNTHPHHVPQGAASDAPADVPHPAPAPAAPLSGRALLAALEQMAQAELAGMAGNAKDEPRLDPTLAWLGWDMGLSGPDVMASGQRTEAT
ncbi:MULTISPECIES: hypothetical protein [Stenotrophomonas]|jgi:hypothetical protein|uniref:Uncharacterized protein n=1 Tax=Stenotrophomonas aracearum TaxID=3003272 RepID=A0ABY9YIC0_9GAMM|nr:MULTISPECIES: hypothetical protein [unclassified Stenotrophomonas]WNH50386.1 hypothetical protein PDM28_08895 [Stenotrophomonas sp. A5588]